MTPIFDRARRDDEDPRRAGEGTYRFLNRVGGAQWDEVRAALESWWVALPATARADVRGRLRSDDQQFAAAWWELYLFTALRSGGFEVTCHPPVPGTSRRPDFLAESGNCSFYLEARYVSAAEHVAVGEGELARLREALARLRCPEQTLRVAVVRRGAGDVRLRPLLRGIQAWMQDRPCSVREFSDGTGWSLRAEVIPSSVDAPGIGAPSGGGLTDETAPLHRALNSKTGRYGRLDRPLVLAVNQQVAGGEAAGPSIELLPGPAATGQRGEARAVLLARNLDHRHCLDPTMIKDLMQRQMREAARSC